LDSPVYHFNGDVVVSVIGSTAGVKGVYLKIGEIIYI
jgi:hypothetical protein